MAIVLGLSPSRSVPVAEQERRRLDQARLQAEAAVALYRREMVSARRRRAPEAPGEKARRLALARSEVSRARDELESRLERVGALTCPTAPQAVLLVIGFRQASRTLEEAMSLLRTGLSQLRGPR